MWRLAAHLPRIEFIPDCGSVKLIVNLQCESCHIVNKINNDNNNNNSHLVHISSSRLQMSIAKLEIINYNTNCKTKHAKTTPKKSTKNWIY